MAEHTPDGQPTRQVWRRAAPPDGVQEPLRCGDPEASPDGADELRREQHLAEATERVREQTEAQARTAAGRRPARKPAPADEDETRAIERFRNDRYAVKLLHQEDSAWGGAGGDAAGALG
jgi:hypothetical protein